MIESPFSDPGAAAGAPAKFAENPGRPARGIGARHLALLFVAALLFHCLGNWSLPLIDRDEPRFSEASREMLERGDYVVPFFNGKERFDKPALTYWLQCGAYRVFGVNEFAARFHAAVCAALVAVALAAWTARLFDPATGWRAAIIFSTCLQTLVHARAAVADMPMVLFVVLAAWSGWEWHRAGSTKAGAGREWKHALLFGAALGLGFLAKGPIALLPLGMVWWSGLAPVASARRHAAQWAAALLLMVAIVGAWGIPALVATHGAFAKVGLGRHVLERSVGALEGHGGEDILSYLMLLPFYLLTIWGTFFPWSIWLYPAMRHAFRHAAGRGSIERYLLVGTLLCFGIFTLVRTKLPHYTLPVFPFLAIFVAAWWREAARPARTFRRTVLVTICSGLFLFLVAFPLAESQFPAEALYRQARPLLRPEMSLATVDYDEPSIVWLFRGRIHGYQVHLKESRLDEWLAQPGPRVVILSEKTARRLAGKFDPAWPVFHAEGWHPVKGRRLRLALVIKDTP